MFSVTFHFFILETLRYTIIIARLLPRNLVADDRQVYFNAFLLDPSHAVKRKVIQ